MDRYKPLPELPGSLYFYLISNPSRWFPRCSQTVIIYDVIRLVNLPIHKQLLQGIVTVDRRGASR